MNETLEPKVRLVTSSGGETRRSEPHDGHTVPRPCAQSPEVERVGYFTAGTIGAGHIVRGLAIGRALKRLGCKAEYRIFAPHGPAAQGRVSGLEINARELRNPVMAARSTLADELARFAPDLLLVDLFWAPLRHVLPHLRCPVWLLVRSCPPNWFGSLAGFTFEPSQYERLIAIEPVTEHLLADRVEPVVIANPDERQPASAIRERFDVGADQRLEVVLCSDGQPRLPVVQRERHRVTVHLNRDERIYPACEWLAGADTIHAAAGYNAYWESAWLGYQSRTTFRALRRPIDDQAARLAQPPHRMAANGADTLAAQIAKQ